MKVTHVAIFENRSFSEDYDKLLGSATITFDNCFVVHALKVIVVRGSVIVSMPQARVRSNCPKCHTKNSLASAYCNWCKTKLEREEFDQYYDQCHPISNSYRLEITTKVLLEWQRHFEATQSKHALYVCDDGTWKLGLAKENRPIPRISYPVDESPQIEPPSTFGAEIFD